MPYDEELAFRLKARLDTVDGVTERRMFGGLAFLLRGNMAVAALGSGGLMVRLDPRDAERALVEPFTGPMDMGDGRRPKGWVRVLEGGYETDDALGRWIDAGLAFAATLPSK